MKKKVIIGTVILSVIFSSIAFYIFDKPSRTITLQKAYELSCEEALKWNSNALLYFVTSADISNDTSEMREGKRTAWNFDYTEVNSTDHFIIEIRFGKIYSKVPVQGPRLNTDNLISTNEFNYDFSSALKKAKIDFSIKPGTSWAIGYHCIASKTNGIPNICVIGQNLESMQMRIYYNLETGSFIEAEQKSFNGGGVFFNDKKAELFQNNTWGTMGIAINDDCDSYLVWGYDAINSANPSCYVKEYYKGAFVDFDVGFNVIGCCYSSRYEDNNIIYALSNNNIYFTKNKGVTWASVFSGELEIQDYYFGNNLIAITADNQMYLLRQDTNTVETINFPQNHTDNSKVMLFNNDILVFEERQLYVYNNNDWKDIEITFGHQVNFFGNTKNNLILASSNDIYILDASFKIVQTIDIKSSGEISNLHCDNDDSFYIISGNNISSYKFKEGGYLCSNEIEFGNGKIEEVTENSIDQIIICAMPVSNWEKVT